jgi:peptidoglycan/LPS O-acetylase OafA/YrhL
MNNRVGGNTIPMITELRGVAALFIYHHHLPDLIPAFVVFGRAYIGVDFFFILSGYVMTHVYHEWFYPRFLPYSFRNFFCARFGRIYPLYFVVASVFLVLTGLIYARWPVSGYFHEIFGLNIFRRWPGQNVVAWSISCEILAYVFAPFLLHWITAEKPWTIAIAFLISLLELYWVVFVYAQTLSVHSFVRCLPEFTFGICVYQVCRRWPLSGRSAGWLSIASVLSLCLLLGFIPSDKWGDLGCALSFCIMIPAAAHLRGRFVRVFSLLFGYLGDISYSLYLIHSLLILALQPLWHKLVPWLGTSHLVQGLTIYFVTTTLLVLIASLSYRYVELPARNFFKRAQRRPTVNLTPPTAVPKSILT